MGDEQDREQHRLERQEDSQIATLRLTYEELQKENLRLRDARGSLTGQLGPLPISAAIVAGLVSGFSVSGGAHFNEWFALGALLVFVIMVIVSVNYSHLTPYRKLRDEMDITDGEAIAEQPGDGRSVERAWYVEVIELERGVRGRWSPRERSPLSEWWTQVRSRGLRSAFRGLVCPEDPRDLQAAYDVEWRGVSITKGLFAVVIVLLILARIV